PRALRADLDDIASEHGGPAGQLVEFGGGRDAAAVGGKAAAKDVRDVHEVGRLANGTFHAGELADVLGRPQQLRVGVAYVESGEPAFAELADDGVAGQPVIDHAGQGAPIPMTGSLGGELAAFRARRAAAKEAKGKPSRTGSSRGKKVYGITDRGEQLFEELLAADNASNDDDRLFNLKLAFARYLP